MKDNYKLEKEYTIPFETFRDGYTAFQKKFVYPRSYVLMAVFVILAIVFAAAVIEDKSQYIAYMLIVICAALAAREWYNPRKLRSHLLETVKAMGEVTYRIGVADDRIEISTAEVPDAETSAEDGTEIDGDKAEELLPEKTVIPFDENYSLLEYEGFFLIFSGKEIFYIVPKAQFSLDELEIIRKTGKTAE